MLDERSLIEQLYNLISTNSINNELINYIVDKVNSEYSQSYVLNYYIGLYYEQQHHIGLAEDYYKRSIELKPLFAAPCFQLADILINKKNFREAEQLLKHIFNKKTLDPYSSTGAYNYNFMNDLRVISTLIPKYLEVKDHKNAEHYIKEILPKFKGLNKYNLVYRHLEIWKQVCLTYAEIYTKKYFNMEKAHEYYHLGLEGLCEYKHTQKLDIYENLHKLDIKLYQGFIMSSHYVNQLTPKKLSFDVNDLFDRYRTKTENDMFEIRGFDDDGITLKESSTRKIKIGYISPDFNKNAVGLFVTPLLKHYDKSKFEIFVYYKNKSIDEFTQIFQSYVKKDNWFNISEMNVQELFSLMKYNHELDVLVDLISLGVGSSMELFAKKPAKTIINYLGFPDVSGLKEIDCRIVDAITDPNIESKSTSNHETLVYMPKCFICYSLFENVPMPNIRYNNDTNFVFIGAMNKLTKHSDIIRKTWLEILDRQKSYVLCLKLGQDEDMNMAKELYKNFPKNQIRFLPFTNTLPEYFDQFNSFDFCVDTYPYSGTTTTCSSLLMGVPVFTIYLNNQSHHVSNVTASINTFSGNEETNCKSFKEYKNKILSYKVNKITETEERVKRRDAFLKCMNPKKFMKDYENVINNIINK